MNVSPAFQPLPRTRVLLAEAWHVFTSHFRVLLTYTGIRFLTAKMLILCMYGIFLLGNRGFVSFETFYKDLSLFVVLALFFLESFVYTFFDAGLNGIIVTVHKKKTRKQFFHGAYKSAVIVFPVLIGEYLIVFGGFLFLLLPGIVLAVWAGFGTFIAAEEKKSGLYPFVKSREYVRGRFIGVLGRMAAFFVPFFIIMTFFYFFLLQFFSPIIAPFFYEVLLIPLLPFAYIYHFVLFEHLKKIRGTIVSSETNVLSFKLAAFWGIFFIILIVFFSGKAVAYFAQENKKNVDRSRMMQQMHIRRSLRKYYMSNNIYPKTLSELRAFDKTLFLDEDALHTFHYSSMMPTYTLCVDYELSQTACISE